MKITICVDGNRFFIRKSESDNGRFSDFKILSLSTLIRLEIYPRNIVFFRHGMFHGTDRNIHDISVNLYDGASIGVDVNVQDEAFKSRGIVLDNDTISAANGGKIAFSLIGVSGDLAEGCGPYALFTCAAEKMEELKNNIRVNNPWPGESVSVNYAEKVNGDGTVTLSASFYHCGLRVIVR